MLILFCRFGFNNRKESFGNQPVRTSHFSMYSINQFLRKQPLGIFARRLREFTSQYINTGLYRKSAETHNLELIKRTYRVVISA
jgi:hypothetical protein